MTPFELSTAYILATLRQPNDKEQVSTRQIPIYVHHQDSLALSLEDIPISHSKN
jgi:hypothetical protein